jgi:hypothetical protein
MKLIETKTLTTTTATVSFTSIPQTYTDLVVLLSARHGTTTNRDLWMQFNEVSGNLSSRRLTGNGSSAFSSNTTIIATNADIPGPSQTANTFSSYQAYIPNYTSNLVKTVSIDSVGENNGAVAHQNIVAGLWNVASPITSIQLVVTAASFVAGTTISLYGITAGSDGITTAS